MQFQVASLSSVRATAGLRFKNSGLEGPISRELACISVYSRETGQGNGADQAARCRDILIFQRARGCVDERLRRSPGVPLLAIGTPILLIMITVLQEFVQGESLAALAKNCPAPA
jgi:hypothetical protein